VAEVVGRIAGGKTGNITGLAINPLSGDLYALDKHGGTNRLLTINKTDGGLITDVGRMSGLGERVCRGEDMAFDSAGYLYVADDSDDELYRVSAATAAIVAVVDNKLEGGLGKKPRFEALAWDAESARMVGYSDRCDYFAQITLENGNNSSYGRFAELTDVEGMRFAAAPAVPEPGTLGVIIVGGVLTLIRRSRRK